MKWQERFAVEKTLINCCPDKGCPVNIALFKFMLSSTLLARILKKQKVGNRAWRLCDLGYPSDVSERIAKMFLPIQTFMYNEFIFEGVDCTLGAINASDLY